MKVSAIVSALFFTAALADIGDYCKDSKGNIGTCQLTSKCNKLDGTIVKNLCPNDPDNVRCCFYPSCNGNGICKKDTLSCAGAYSTGDCPGPKGYRCCNKELKPPICGRGENDRRCIVP
ncbi:glycoside hydrolase family 24 protein [Colletotrichum truncatum]|uniref:Glycoside hydrolase family 24 protein n=1 Tax=Colletotrichum truncatum TaxID=5467 RepID=A0ACC3Z895_COLTU|nr:glycoside hydrolase family 24 protein [Colletotrichum truncatum]KAF6789126.1 glycoside hydrolase family 24 protein [Colletotrichum truncatum]